MYFSTASGATNTGTATYSMYPICTKSDYRLGAPGSNACTVGARILVTTECQEVATRTGFTVRAVTRASVQTPRARASLASCARRRRVSHAPLPASRSLPSLRAVECHGLGHARWLPPRSINVAPHGLL